MTMLVSHQAVPHICNKIAPMYLTLSKTDQGLKSAQSHIFNCVIFE